MCFFFQAEDGIRDWSVTGVQTCALPITVQQRDAPAGARRTKPPDPDTANPFDALFGLEHIPAQTIGVEISHDAVSRTVTCELVPLLRNLPDGFRDGLGELPDEIVGGRE